MCMYVYIYTVYVCVCVHIKHGNEPSDFITCMEFVDQVRYCQRMKKFSSTWEVVTWFGCGKNTCRKVSLNGKYVKKALKDVWYITEQGNLVNKPSLTTQSSQCCKLCVHCTGNSMDSRRLERQAPYIESLTRWANYSVTGQTIWFALTVSTAL
jgi:hypothetical protein